MNKSKAKFHPLADTLPLFILAFDRAW